MIIYLLQALQDRYAQMIQHLNGFNVLLVYTPTHGWALVMSLKESYYTSTVKQLDRKLAF